MTKRTKFSRFGAGLAASALILGIPAVAFAGPGNAGLSTAAVAGSGSAGGTGAASSPRCSPAVFSLAQTKVESALTSRASTLTSLSSDVQAASALTAGDRATITATLASTSAGIQALVTKVPSDTTCAQLLVDAKSMVQTYRVFAVVAPQTHLAIVADKETAVETLVVSYEPGIEQLINAAQADGKNVTAAQAAYADLQTQVTNAQSSSNGVSATVLSQTAASYPGSNAVLVSARNSVKAADTDLHTAKNDLSTIIGTLK